MSHTLAVSPKTIVLGTGELTIEEVVGVARYGWVVAEIGEQTTNPAANEAYLRIKQSREWVEKAMNADTPPAYYGINTGFGSKAGRKPLPKSDIPWVSRNLIVSHATGVGESLHPEIVRAAILIRANSLAQGYSGVREELINTLVKMLNEGICPAIPEYGSVGASGDLAPLSHLALVLSKRPVKENENENFPVGYDECGYAYVEKRNDENLTTVLTVNIHGVKKEYGMLNGHEAMRRRGIEPIELSAKEGLAFNNGATFSAAIATLALYDSEIVARHAEIATSLCIEALLGFRDAFFPQVQYVRHHKGQQEVANRIIQITKGSALLDGDVNVQPNVVPPQDAYSIRVTPQVIGAVWDTLGFIRQTLTNEINAATDNPLVFNLPDDHPLHLPREYRVVSGGNFHGAPIGYAMDFLGIIVTDLGSLCERQIFKLTDPNLSDKLPSMLIEEKREGLTSGMMIPQYLAAGLVSECKTLSHPDSVDSIPTSANQEDHVSMSMNAALHARKIVENVSYVVAIELLCVSIGLYWRINVLTSDNGEKEERIRGIREKEKILYLKKHGIVPEPGKGSKVALDIIDKKLYSGEHPLPELGKSAADEDRYLQPYVLRMTTLLQSGELVREVYKECNIPLSFL